MAGVGYTGQPWWATAPLICQKQGLETPARGTLLRRGLHPQRPHSRSWLLRIAPITVSTAVISQAWDQTLGVDTCCQGAMEGTLLSEPRCPGMTPALPSSTSFRTLVPRLVIKRSQLPREVGASVMPTRQARKPRLRSTTTQSSGLSLRDRTLGHLWASQLVLGIMRQEAC